MRPSKEIKLEIDSPSEEFLKNENHTLNVRIEGELSDVYLEFSSRLAMREFAKSLLYASVYGESGLFEHSPDTLGSNLPVEDGVRLARESVRLFVFYPGTTYFPEVTDIEKP